MNALYPWLSPIYRQITDAFLAGRGHHAQLFRSENGLGTEKLIRRFADFLLCRQPQNNDACGVCKSCLLTQSGNHPDFYEIASLDGKEISVEQIREMNTRLQQFSQQGGNVVVYFPQAERLTEAAANALLKTLEEPRDGTYFLLVAPLQTAMLATIQSRCQTWVLHTPEPSQALAWLQAQCPQVSDDDLQTALRLCHFRPLSSKNFIESDRLPKRKAFMQNFWRFYKRRDLWLLLQDFGQHDLSVAEQLEWLETFFGDALKAKLGIASGWINEDLRAGIVPFSQALSEQKLLDAIRLLQTTQRELQQINAVNQELMLADCLAKMLSDILE